MMMGMFTSHVPAVSVAELAAGTYLIDVRGHDEWAAGHAPDAHHLPMHEIPERLDDVPRDRGVAVVCRVGARSAQVTAFLRAQGWDNVVNLAGGMLAWEAA